MKNLKYILLPLILFVISCSTSQKIMVSGVPGTEILSPQREHLGTIGQNGQLELLIPSYSGYEFLLSRTSGDGQCVPFALDYEEHNYSGARFSHIGGSIIYGVGGALILAGSLTVIGSAPVGLTMVGIGASFFAAGMPMMFVGGARANQTAYEWNYRYLNGQSTNQDIPFTDVVNTGISRITEPPAPKPVIQAAVTPKPAQTARPAKSTTSARSFKDYSKEVCGVYRGTGKLMLRGAVIENFLAVSVEIQQMDKRTVSVDVQEGGTSFFYNKMTYSLAKDSQDGYILTSTDINEATIKINSSHNLIYIHPSVEIDGEIYSLELNCKKL